LIILYVRLYLQYPLSYEHVAELMAERGIEVDASCIWRWVQAYAPELNKRCRPHLKPTNKSYRIDETYIKVKGQDKYLYRALDSAGQTIDFLLTAKRDTAAAKRFLRMAIDASDNAMPRVMNVDKNPAYPAAVEALKAEGALPRRVALRQLQISQQCDRTRPPDSKETSLAGQGLRFFPERVADFGGNRNSAHDPEGTSEMAGKRRCDRSSTLHW
jgi:transposase, IS6 family